MELTHSFAVPASIDQAWALFMDLREVGECFPGATVTEVTDDGFTGQVKVRLGPIAMVYAGTGRITERDDASHRAVIDGRGKDKRGNGMAGATATIQLSQGGSGQTQVDVSTDLTITGKPAQFGRGVIQDISDKLLGQFISCIEGKLSQPTPRSAGEPVGAGVAGEAGGAAGSGSTGSTDTSSTAGVESGAGAGSGAGRSDAPREPLTAAMFGATGAGFAGLGAGSGTSGSESSGAEASGTPVSGTGETPAPAAAPAAASPPPGLTTQGPDSAPGSGSRFTGGQNSGSGDSDDALDLGATVLPVIARAYAPQIGIGIAAFWIGWKLGRRLPG